MPLPPRRKPSEQVRAWLPMVGWVLVAILILVSINLFRTGPPVAYDTLKGDALGYDDGSWDHFEAVAIAPATSRADIQKLLEHFQRQYSQSDEDRVLILIFNDRHALLNADDSRLVGRYQQDRAKSEFKKELTR